MKVQLKEQSYHRLRNRPRNNISDSIVDSEYNIKQLPNYEPASKLFLRTCLNQRDLNSKNLQTSGHSEWMLSSSSYSTQFSEDGTYFVYGDCSPIIQFWEVGKVLVNKIAQHPTAFKFDDHVCCMALSPDATRILAGCRRKVTIYDIQTGEHFDIACPKAVDSISIQSFNSKRGDIFTLAGYDGKLRLFDLRKSTTDSVMYITTPVTCWVNCIAFSPANKVHVAIAGKHGTELVDLRKPVGIVRSFPSPKGTLKIQFDAKGSRLLCIEKGQPVAVYDLSKPDGDDVYLTTPGYTGPDYTESGCFAGVDDELVTFGSDKSGKITIWHVSQDQSQQGVRTIDEALITLFHGEEMREKNTHLRRYSDVCYNSSAGVLASGFGYVHRCEIKFWTPLSMPESLFVPRPATKPFIIIGHEGEEISADYNDEDDNSAIASVNDSDRD